MIADACTYFPPTCWMTLAYSFSAPTAMIVPADPADPADPAAGPFAGRDTQPQTTRAALTATAAARDVPDLRMP